jgi:hypothetical protein
MAGKTTQTETATPALVGADILKGLSPEAQALFAMQSAMLEEMRAAREVAPHAQAQAFAKINDPSNKSGPNISTLNPRGEKDFPMPKLKCEIWAPWRSRPEDHGLDREEVELFNLLEPGEYVVELVDGTPHKVVVIPQRHSLSGALTRLTLSGALNEDGKATPLFTQESKTLFPSMRLMLREILGDKANGVMTMKQELKLIADGKLAVSVGE